MNFKLSTLVSASLLTCASGLTMAAESDVSFSGTAAMTTDYRYRGITQTESDPSVQAGFALTHASGLYAGVWGSNVNFGDASPAHLELDPYVGYSTELSSFASKPVLDVGLWYYGYPSESDLNWLELYAKLGFADALTTGDSLLASVNFTNDFVGSDNDAWYLNLTYSVPFGASNFGGVASVGYTTADDYDFSDTDSGDDNYIDWKLGVTYGFASVEGLSAELAAIGTNIDAEAQPYKRGVETGAVFTITKAF